MSNPCTCSECNAKKNRTAAFGAIRRAAKVARECERKARESEYQAYLLWREYHEIDGKDERDYARLCCERADAIRTGIRAAIGSDKA